MLLELAITGIVGLVAWRMYGPSKTSTIADALNSYTDNGYQFRDVTYADKLEFWHPDVKNNHYYFNSNQIAHDRGENAVPRAHTQLYGGMSEITQVYRTDNLFL